MSEQPPIDPRRFEVPTAPIWPFVIGAAVVLAVLVMGIAVFTGDGPGEEAMVQSGRQERVNRLAEASNRQSAAEQRPAGRLAVPPDTNGENRGVTPPEAPAASSESATPPAAPAADDPAQPASITAPSLPEAADPETGPLTPVDASPGEEPSATDDPASAGARQAAPVTDPPASHDEPTPTAADPQDPQEVQDAAPRRPGPDIAAAMPETDAAELSRLMAQAERAFEARDDNALALLRDVAVRLQGQAQRAAARGLTNEADEARSQLEFVLERIRALERAAPGNPTLPGEGAGPGVEVDPDTRMPHNPPRPGEVRQMTIFELGNFRYDERVGGIPEDIEALTGLEVRISGFMVPTYQTDRIREFALVPDIFECCFGEPPGLEHMVYIVLPEGRAVTFHHGEIEVRGKLLVEEQKEDGYVVNLFTISDVTSVRATGR